MTNTSALNLRALLASCLLWGCSTAGANSDAEKRCANIDRPAARDDCFRELATESREPGPCSAIENAFRRDRCLYGVAVPSGDWRGLPQPNANLAGCSAISDSAQRDRCYANAAPYTDDPVRACEQAGRLEQFCFHQLAEHGDPALCERVGATADSFARRSCYRRSFRRNSGPPVECGNVQDRARQQECMRFQQPRACNEISDEIFADECWFSSAHAKRELCDRIKNVELRAHCAEGYPRPL